MSKLGEKSRADADMTDTDVTPSGPPGVDHFTQNRSGRGTCETYCAPLSTSTGYQWRNPHSSSPKIIVALISGVEMNEEKTEIGQSYNTTLRFAQLRFFNFALIGQRPFHIARGNAPGTWTPGEWWPAAAIQ